MICPFTGKEIYKTRRKANDAKIDIMVRKGRQKRMKTNVYFCGSCNGFHYGRKAIVKKYKVMK